MELAGNKKIRSRWCGRMRGIMIFETHAHYDDDAFEEDREAVLKKVTDSGVAYIINVGSNMESTEETLEYTRKYPFIYGAAGVHPSEADELNETLFSRLQEIVKEDKILAVGEIGLDYYWDEPDRDIQKKWFVRQLALARESRLPVIIHSRDAAKDTYDIMKAEKAEEIGGVIHCFSYGKEMAEMYLNMGFYLGIGGVVTFNNAKKLKEVVEYAPLERLVTETDCPYLAPVPNRGKRNDSSNLVYVVDMIAELKGMEREIVEQQLFENAKRLYRMQ